jgi:hypothetical protein
MEEILKIFLYKKGYIEILKLIFMPLERCVVRQRAIKNPKKSGL